MLPGFGWRATILVKAPTADSSAGSTRSTWLVWWWGCSLGSDQRSPAEVFCSQTAPVTIERAPVPPMKKGSSRAPLRLVRNETRATTAVMAPIEPMR